FFNPCGQILNYSLISKGKTYLSSLTDILSFTLGILLKILLTYNFGFLGLLYSLCIESIFKFLTKILALLLLKEKLFD
ncbi:hypothetical protein AB4356_24270, partial [Vibrio lentus]